MNQTGLSWVIVGLGALVVIAGVVLVVWQFLLTRQAKNQVLGLADDKWEGFKKVLEALAKLPAGDRLIFYGVVLIVIGGVVGGWIDLSVGASAGKTS